jgi:hypothetical protein
MTKIQDIVPINLSSTSSRSTGTTQHLPQKSKLALRIKQPDFELNVYNGCDKYILYAALKEVISHDC